MRRKIIGVAAILLMCATSVQAQLSELVVHDDNSDGAGNPGLSEPASAAFVGGELIVKAAGRDYWGGSDDGVYVYDPAAVAGDFTAIVRHVGIGNEAGNPWGRSGLMARADAVAANSANVAVYRRSGNGNTILAGRDGNGGGTGGEVGIGPDLDPNVPFWMSLSRTGAFFTAAYAPDDAGAPGVWESVATRAVSGDLSGDLFLGLASQAHEHPRVSTFTYSDFSVGAFDPQFAFATFPFPVPADAGSPGLGTLAITEVINNGGIGNQDAAGESLTNGGGDRLTYDASVLNLVNSGGNGHFGDDSDFALAPVHANPADVNDISFYITGIVTIPEGEGGDYTFGVNSDDGFRLQFPGKDFAHTGGGGGIAATDNGLSLEFFGGRGTADTLGVVNLEAGDHVFQMTAHEGGGGAAVELFAAKGVKGGFDADFRLVGHKAAPDRVVVTPGVVGELDILTIDLVGRQVNRGTGMDPNGSGLQDAITLLSDPGQAVADGHLLHTGTATFIDHSDPESNGAPAAFAGLDDGVANDEFVTAFDGVITVPEDAVIQFHIGSDDGAGLFIEGADWTILSSGNAGATSVIATEAAGDTIAADFFTGNSNVLAETFLTAGEHRLTAIQFEGGGGAWLRIRTGGPNGPVLGSVAAGVDVISDMDGLQLAAVPEPSSLVLAGLALLGFAGMVRRRRK